MTAWQSLIGAGLLLASTTAYAQRGIRPIAPPEQQPLVVTVTPWGPDQEMVDQARAMVASAPAVMAYLDGTRHRLLSFEYLDSANQPPEGFRAVFYDYTNNRAVIAEGLFKRPESISVQVKTGQPQSSAEEFEAAVAILERDPIFGPLIGDGSMVPYPPMPPVIESSATDSYIERTVTVGLHSQGGKVPSEIVGVNMVRESVVRFEGGAPPTATVNSSNCGTPGAGQSTTPRGTAGQFQITVTQGGTQLWTFLAIRPSVSSGTRASAIEIRDVFYRGKKVLKRGHVPILNVQYVNNACGPYRDWQWQEGFFDAIGTDVAPGVRSCSTPAQTFLDDGTDLGNFRGFAFYTLGTEVVLVTELEAGWYRYINEWRFDSNGTIRPRFRFGGVFNSCVCFTHTHHVYFRLDFDIVTAEKNLVSEINARAFAIPRTAEIASLRSPTGNRRWQIENAASGERYLVVPGPHDGIADVYGRGDVWLLRYRATELDDGHNSTGSNTEADLDQFVNGELLEFQDIVMWYGGHTVHEGGAEMDDDVHAVGPDLVPVNW